MLFGFVALYLLCSVGIGLYAATRVQNTKDFAVAGRSLPLPVVTATVFATWFGAEAVLGISATFVKEGLRGVVADPFGSSLCLILAGLFFAPRFYRMNLLTVGDFYRLRYNRTVEVLCTLAVVASYLGWVAAQFKVLGLVLNVVTDGGISQSLGMIAGLGVFPNLLRPNVIWAGVGGDLAGLTELFEAVDRASVSGFSFTNFPKGSSSSGVPA